MFEKLRSFFPRLFRSASSTPVGTSGSGTSGFSDWLILGSNPLSVAAAYRCVDVIARNVAVLPMRVQWLQGNIFTDRPADRLAYLLNVQPSPEMSAVDFREALVRQLLLHGNAYILPTYTPATADLDRLVLCSPHSVSFDATRQTYTVSDLAHGISGTFHQEEIIHLKYATLDGRTGMSVLSYARQTLDTAAIGDAETHKRFSNGGNARGFVTNDKSLRGFGEYADDELAKTAKTLDERFAAGEKIVHLPGSSDFRQITMTSADMQFLESRKFAVREVCRFFGVHPSFVFDDTSSNYKSSENAYADFLRSTLNPLLAKIECELLRKLFPPSLAHKRRILFDRAEITACDLESRVRYQTATIAAGLFTVNEWRAAENKPPVEGGDRVLVSANLRDISDTSTDDTPPPPPPTKDTPSQNPDPAPQP